MSNTQPTRLYDLLTQVGGADLARVNVINSMSPVLAADGPRVWYKWIRSLDIDHLDTDLEHATACTITKTGYQPIRDLSYYRETGKSPHLNSIAFTMGQWLGDIGRFMDLTNRERYSLRYTTDQSEYRRFNLLEVSPPTLRPGPDLEIKELIPYIREIHPELWTTTADITIGVRNGKVHVDPLLSYPV